MSDGAFESTTRRTALVVSWISYAVSYLGRKGFSAVKVPMQAELGLSTAALGIIDSAFLAAYALGQFASGVIGDRVAPRRLVGVGLLASAAACLAVASATTAAVLVALFALNGLAQSTGWPGTTRIVAEWTPRETRGRVMAVWSTCYQVGGFVATPFAAWLATRSSWDAAFRVPAFCMAGVAAVALVAMRSPKDAKRDSSPNSSEGSVPVATPHRVIFRSPTLWLYGGSYFFIKLIRYALLLWLPFYLKQTAGYSLQESGWIAVAFDAGGLLGVLLMGRLSDRSRLSHPALSALWLVALAGALALYAAFGRTGTIVNVLLLALVGALLFGPDSLLAGAAAQAAGPPEAAARAAGFVNGLGSLGAVLQGFIVPTIEKRFGWHALFPVFVGFGLLAALVLVPSLRAARRRATPDPG
jgi:sugar phosphate permease